MFDTPDISLLRDTLNAYPVAIFAAQRGSPHHAFRVLCINKMHERISGVLNEEVEGLRPSELLIPDDGSTLEARYQFCMRTNRAIHHEEILHMSEEPSRWRTTLFPVRMRRGVQRVVCTAVCITPQPAHTVAFPVSARMQTSITVTRRGSTQRSVSSAFIGLDASQFYKPLGQTGRTPANIPHGADQHP